MVQHEVLSCSPLLDLSVAQLQQQEVQRLQKQREQQQKLEDQQSRRRLLDRGLRLKMKRLAREQQDELQLDMNILQQLLRQDTDERQEAVQRKVNTLYCSAPQCDGRMAATAISV